ncbi:hypothetical protein J6590_102172 [Homalodisca vitripennis]|nr:hypothetical protein J6590_102172 [Homalodisca vitripennis]
MIKLVRSEFNVNRNAPPTAANLARKCWSVGVQFRETRWQRLMFPRKRLRYLTIYANRAGRSGCRALEVDLSNKITLKLRFTSVNLTLVTLLIEKGGLKIRVSTFKQNLITQLSTITSDDEVTLNLICRYYLPQE